MNAHTATPSAIIPKISATDSVDFAPSTTPKRIDAYIARLFNEARSENFSLMKSTAQAAVAHGFTSCANLRYAEFLEAYRSTPLQAYYEEHYPQCCFLPWKALRSLLDAMRLWCDLPAHYVGAIPPEQLPWLDLFSLRSEDEVSAVELADLVGLDENSIMRGILHDILSRNPNDFPRSFELPASPPWERQRYQLRDEQRQQLNRFATQFRESFFVVAPPEAFNVTSDFCQRFRTFMDAVQRPTTPPDDPLVVRFVKGGCLVVAAWGEEAATLNQLVSEVTNPTL